MKPVSDNLAALYLVHGIHTRAKVVYYTVALYQFLWRESLVHTALRMCINLHNFRLNPDIPLFHHVMINVFGFHNPQSYVDDYGTIQLPVFP